MRRAKIPRTTASRLPIYLRTLSDLANKEVEIISSYDLAELVGGNPARLRKDLSYLGELGTRGVGYNISHLIYRINKSLGLTKRWSVAIVGMGRVGTALVHYPGFKISSFEIAALFDRNPRKVGKELGGLTIHHINDLTKEFSKVGGIDIGIITTPPSAAQEVADKLIEAGVKALMNFAPARIDVPSHVLKRQTDVLLDLQILSFYLAAKAKKAS